MSKARVGQWMCLGGAVLGALGLFAWATGATDFTTFVPGGPPMMPNTALALLLAGVSGALRHRRGVSRAAFAFSLLMAAVVLAIGLGTLAEYALGADLRIDQLLFRAGPPPYPGRPSPPTALALSLLGVALFLYDFRPTVRKRPADWLIIGAGLTALSGLMGHFFGVGPLYRLTRAPVIGVSLPTALSLLFTSFGLLLERPDVGVMRSATASGPGGVLVRRMVLPTILAPALLGLLITRLLAVTEVEASPISTATLATALIALGIISLILTAGPLNRTYEALQVSEAWVRDIVDQASDGLFIANMDGRYTEVNRAACDLLGMSREEIIGKTILDLIPQEDARRLSKSKEDLVKGVTEVAEWRLRHKSGAYIPVEVSAKILSDGRWQALVRDITERKRTEEALKQSEQDFKSLAESMPQIVWATGADGLNTYFNQQWVDYTGLTLEESHGEGWITPFHPDDRQRAWEAWRRATRHHESYSLECRLKRADGVYKWWLIRGVPLLGADGEILKWFGTCTDIDQIKVAEQRLKESEAKFSGIVSVSSDAIISIDGDQRITLFNDGAARIFGHSKAEAIGAPLEILIPDRFRAIHRQHVETFASGDVTARRMGERRSTISGVRKNGEEFPADAAISKIDVGGKSILTVALRDVTEQKRIEHEQRFLAEVGSVLASSLDYEETLASVARLAVRDLADVCTVDIVGEDGEIRRLRVATRDPSKAWAGELLTQIPFDRERPHMVWSVIEKKRTVILPQVTPEVVAAVAQSEEHLQAIQALDVRTSMAVPLLVRGRVLGVLYFSSSTPSREYGPADVRLAEELAQRAALVIEKARLYRTAQRAIQARDDVLGIVAHDLRNPLNNIVLQSTRLRRRGTEPERRSQAPAETIQRAATRMQRLIQDLLDVSTMEAGRLSIERSRVSTDEIVPAVVEAQRPLATSASIELRIDKAGHVPEVWADRDRLVQVFENLIGNAVKFTGPGGHITVGAAPQDGEVLFWVADTGQGIAEESVPHIFDRFWQARKTGRGGAGLGLPIVKGIVEAHGGHIWVESTPGRGSTFVFKIPAAPPVGEWRSDEPRV